ncbi:BamA/TamA family outer membrane protein [Erythrobacter sp. sf7]|uniref:BamA/TamA family outer membrane protein n=1 Tax=Erythrobacter fulvus TaxID=2987523 RepID=A0ABT5JRA6_9SPHN|nr:BamA/TamA family outer membrane protein [Erythrobacter fulvus]MDC8754092.1 BamA/TamA family outer membrane protein [Erythrobacter fulvus]
MSHTGAALAAQAEQVQPAQANDPAPIAATDPEPSQQPQEMPLPEPAPVPRTLDDLIPPEAVDDPEAWAAAGSVDAGEVSGEASAEPGVLDDPISQELADLLPPPPPGLQPALDAAFADFAVDMPEPLEPDPEVESLASIAAPVLGDLPELADVRIDDTLVLGFPAAEGAFPERREFIARFRELSTLRQLEGDQSSVQQIGARARADAELLDNMLRTYGYYSGEVVRQLSGGRRERENGDQTAGDIAGEPSVRFDLLPGTRYSVGRVDLGPLSRMSGEDAERLLAAFAIQPGDPLYADRFEDRGIELRVALGETGYPFAKLAEPELLIDHARAEGDLSLAVEPGGKYAFGGVVSGDPAFLSSRHLSRIARFEPGDVYRQSLETDLRRAIIATGLVSSVTVTPREIAPPSAGEPGEVALDVAFERAPVRTIAGAIGYGTEDGFKVEGRWEHRNLFPPEGALRLRGTIGTREALGSIGVRRNNFRGRDQVLTADIFASDIQTLAVDSRTIGVRTTFEKVSNILFQKPISWQLGGEVLYTDERNRRVRGFAIDLPRQTYLIGSLFGSLTLDESDDLLDPTTGYRATLFLAPEVSRSQGNETFYLRAQADASAYKSLGSAVLAGRVRAATIQGARFFEVAPSRRLYSGGGGSVRGYGFQGVGPQNDRGEPTGGASLVEVSLEARIETPLFDGAVEVVPFFDAGTVSLGSTPDFRFISYGAGIGVRYKTTFGPIRVDVATPLNPGPFDSPVVVYVSLGQAF